MGIAYICWSLWHSVLEFLRIFGFLFAVAVVSVVVTMLLEWILLDLLRPMVARRSGNK